MTTNHKPQTNLIGNNGWNLLLGHHPVEGRDLRVDDLFQFADGCVDLLCQIIVGGE